MIDAERCNELVRFHEGMAEALRAAAVAGQRQDDGAETPRGIAIGELIDISRTIAMKLPENSVDAEWETARVTISAEEAARLVAALGAIDEAPPPAPDADFVYTEHQTISAKPKAIAPPVARKATKTSRPVAEPQPTPKRAAKPPQRASRPAPAARDIAPQVEPGGDEDSEPEQAVQPVKTKGGVIDELGPMPSIGRAPRPGGAREQLAFTLTDEQYEAQYGPQPKDLKTTYEGSALDEQR